MKSIVFDPTRWGGPALACALAAAACNDDFDPASRVTTLRVLAVRADEPYAHPGETVALDALADDPAGRSLTWGWAACENPADTSVLGCIDALRERAARGESVRLVTGPDLDHFTLTVAADLLTRAPRPLPGRALVGVVAVACPGALEEAILPETTAENPLPIVCRGETGARLSPFDFVAGTKRIFVRDIDRNANPEISRVTFDGKDWSDTAVPSVTACDRETNHADDCPEQRRHRIRVEASPGSVESGTDETGEPFREQLVVQYYATNGTFSDDVRVASDPQTDWVATPSSRGEDVRFWLVLRDDRGGVTWVERRAHVALG